MIDPIDKDISVKSYLNLSKYNDLEKESGKMWILKTRTILFVLNVSLIAKWAYSCLLSSDLRKLQCGRNAKDSAYGNYPYPSNNTVYIISTF